MMLNLVDARLLPSPRRRVLGRATPLGLAVLATLAIPWVVIPWFAAMAQQPATGTISGRITDAESRAPIAGANVLVTGTQLGVQASDSGTYTIRGVPVGNAELTVIRIGYEARRIPVAVVAGQTATVDVRRSHAAYSLAAVVTTATGQQRKVEVSNAIATVNVADQIAQAPVTDISGLLSGRASGVQVVAGGATGSGSRIRIRGQSSLSLNNEPLIYIDGVRVTTTDGWWLLRASNTQDVLVARAESDTPEGLERLLAQIDEQLAASGLSRGA